MERIRYTNGRTGILHIVGMIGDGTPQASCSIQMFQPTCKTVGQHRRGMMRELYHGHCSEFRQIADEIVRRAVRGSRGWIWTSLTPPGGSPGSRSAYQKVSASAFVSRRL